jgi:pilus assembly protein Flp/PilA
LFLGRGREIREAALLRCALSLAKDNHKTTRLERTAMKFELWKLYIDLQNLMAGEEGQDLIEYALVVALIAFAAVGAMQTLAVDINNAFIGVGNTLTAATT